jgi:hypothetical protein
MCFGVGVHLAKYMFESFALGFGYLFYHSGVSEILAYSRNKCFVRYVVCKYISSIFWL